VQVISASWKINILGIIDDDLKFIYFSENTRFSAQYFVIIVISIEKNPRQFARTFCSFFQ